MNRVITSPRLRGMLLCSSIILLPSMSLAADQYWNGGATGTWKIGTTNWTDSGGATTDPWTNNNNAIFQGAGGAATVDTTGGAIAAGGLQFTGNNWSLSGSPLVLFPTTGVTNVSVTGANTATINSNISGTGVTRLNKMDTGTLVLNGANTFSTATVTAGTLQIGTGGTTGSFNGAILNNANLIFNRSDAVLYSGVLTGNGTFTKSGANTLTLSGTSTAYAGNTVVSTGILSVTGRIGGTMTVNSGATLQGTGTVGATTLTNGSKIMPGVGAIGNLNTGAITFQTGSTYVVDVTDAGLSDKIAATGAAAINGGALQVVAGAGTYKNETIYTILTATGGVTKTGTGFSVTTNMAFLNPTLAYNANDIQLTLTRNDLNFAAVGHTYNQSVTGGALQKLGSGSLYHAILVADVPTAQKAFDQLSGEIHASLRGVMVDDTRLPRNAVLSRLASSDDSAVWAEGFGNWGTSDVGDNAASTRRDSRGFVAGADMPVGDNLRLGLSAGYTHTNLEAEMRNSRARIKSVHVIGYAGATFDALHLSAGLGYADSKLETVRSIAFTGFSDLLRGKYNGSVLHGFGEASYAIPMGSLQLSPFANIASVRAHTDSFSENGGLAALDGAKRSETTTFSTLGLRFETPRQEEFSLAANLGWRHGFGTATPVSTLGFTPAASFVVAGSTTERDSVATDIGATWRVWPGLALGAAYNGLLSANSRDEAVRVTVTQQF